MLKGIAGPRLLETYEAERRPAAAFTVEQAYTRYVTRTAPFLGKKDFQPLADDFNIELGYLYRSSAIAPAPGDEVAEGETNEHPSASRGRPGSRAPHVWIQQRGRRISTLDLFTGAFVLLAGPDATAWFDAARAVAARFTGLQVEAHRIVDDGFTEAYGISSSGATLVRPDGFVAWRSKSSSPHPDAELTHVINGILAR